jgi:8-oxo-dGTP pyrophosphatase MutT (NUDIX family)
MIPLRIGVQCAVIDDENRVLLSRREDLNTWNLPGGRLNSGETISDAAVREVREETGIIPHIERAVGLYYLAGWGRLNILYAGWPLGGDLRQRTSESLANQYFSGDDLPDMLWTILPLDAIAATRHKPRVIEMSPTQMRQTHLKLRWRWVKNLLMGRPEPKYPRFNVSAVGIVWEDTYHRVLTFPTSRSPSLPRVSCDGGTPPWDQLTHVTQQAAGVDPSFRWVGLWQVAEHDQIYFFFAATVEEIDLSDENAWSIVRNAGLDDRDTAYVERVQPGYGRDPVWSILCRPDLERGEMIGRKGEGV